MEFKSLAQTFFVTKLLQFFKFSAKMLIEYASGSKLSRI